MCDYMINNRQCLRNPLSGYGTVTNETGDQVAYLCRQHADMRKGGFLDLTMIKWTPKVQPVIVTNQKESNVMITTIAQFAENGKNRVKCVKCSTNDKPVYHNFKDIRSCLGAAPDPQVATHTKFNIPANIHFKVWNGNNNQLMVSEWHKNRHLATKRQVELRKGSIKPAANGHGVWLHYASV